MISVKEEVYKYENYKGINEELRKIGIKNISKIALNNNVNKYGILINNNYTKEIVKWHHLYY
ncbi:hypothetical protein [Clostridium lundense]|uniref:hypothetical protein n=1 Tax=Clostridium lundense TaxID=319475 RepID=UPI0004807550|nr:hypothetical protein [Clostridium lundense]